MIKFRKQQHIYKGNTNTHFLKDVVHNFSSCNLSENENKALSFGFDQTL